MRVPVYLYGLSEHPRTNQQSANQENHSDSAHGFSPVGIKRAGMHCRDFLHVSDTIRSKVMREARRRKLSTITAHPQGATSSIEVYSPGRGTKPVGLSFRNSASWVSEC